jgi:hypothetical protein
MTDEEVKQVERAKQSIAQMSKAIFSSFSPDSLYIIRIKDDKESNVRGICQMFEDSFEIDGEVKYLFASDYFSCSLAYGEIEVVVETDYIEVMRIDQTDRNVLFLHIPTHMAREPYATSLIDELNITLDGKGMPVVVLPKDYTFKKHGIIYCELEPPKSNSPLYTIDRFSR